MTVLLDSGFIYAYYNQQDIHHEIAVKLVKEIEEGQFGAPIITDYIFDETLTLIFSKTGIQNAIIVGKILLNAYEMIEISSNLFQKSWELFQRNKLSFTDCTHVAAMKHHGIEYLATFDSGFKGLVKTLGV